MLLLSVMCGRIQNCLVSKIDISEILRIDTQRKDAGEWKIKVRGI